MSDVEEPRLQRSSTAPAHRASHVQPCQPWRDRQRLLKRLRTRALIRHQILNHGFECDADGRLKGSPADSTFRFVPAPEHQRKVFRKPAQTLRGSDRLYDSYATAQIQTDGYRLAASMQRIHQAQAHRAKEFQQMNQHTLWFPPTLLGLGFIATLILLLITPVGLRPTGALTLLLIFAVALNAAIIPPIAQLIIQWNQRRAALRAEARRRKRLF